MRQDAATVDIDLITNSDVVTEDRHVFQTGPFSNTAVPANDCALNPGMVLDLGSRKNNAALQANTVADDHVGSNGHVGSYSAVLANLGSGIDHDVATVDVGLGGWDQELGSLASQGGQVQAGSGEEVLGLTDIHPETLQVKRVQLAISNHGGEGLLLDRGGAQVDAVEDGCVEDVETGVNTVADELDGLLNESVDTRGVAGLVDNNTVLGGLFDLGDTDSTLIAVRLVEGNQLLEWVFAGDIGVKDEEGGVILAEDVGSELEGAGRA